MTKMVGTIESLLAILFIFQLCRCNAFSSYSTGVGKNSRQRNWLETKVRMTHSESSSGNHIGRREAMIVGGSFFSGLVFNKHKANAAITDERGSFGVADLDDSYGAFAASPETNKRRTVPDDEVRCLDTGSKKFKERIFLSA